MAREALRDRINGERCIDKIDAIAGELECCEPADMPALKLRYEIQRDYLKKILPDVKAVEVSDSDGNALTVKLMSQIGGTDAADD